MDLCVAWLDSRTVRGTARPLTREELDQAAPDNPVLVVAGMERMGTANGRAIAVADIDDAQGLVEGPEVNRIIQAAGEAESWQAGITKLATDFVSTGLTTVFDPRSGFMGQHTFYEPVEQAYESGELPVRFFHTLNGQGRGNRSRGADQISEELESTVRLQATIGWDSSALEKIR